MRTVNKFSMSRSPNASDSPETLEVNFVSPSANAESLRQPTVMQRNSDDKLEFSFEQNRSKSVKQKRRDKHGETRCRGKFDDLHWKASNTTI